MGMCRRAKMVVSGFLGKGLLPGSEGTSGPVVSLRQQIEALETTVGRTETAPLKIFGVDPLPAGVTVDTTNNLIRCTQDVVFEDWAFTSLSPAYHYDLYSTTENISITVRQCIFGDPSLDLNTFNFVQPRGDGSVVFIENCDFYGKDGPGGIGAFLRRDHSGGSYTVRGVKAVNTDSDIVIMSDMTVTESAAIAGKNLDGDEVPWNSTDTFLTGKVVFGLGGDSGRLYKALQDSTNEALPTGTGSNAFWAYFDPHADDVTSNGGDNTLGYMNIGADGPRAGYGSRIRAVRNSGQNGRVGVFQVVGLNAAPWDGNYAYDFARQNNYSVGATYDTGDVVEVGVRLFASLTDGNVGNDPETDFVNWGEILDDGMEGPFVMQHCWIGSGISDYWYPRTNRTADAQASRKGTLPYVLDNVVDFTTEAAVSRPSYSIVENTPQPAFGTIVPWVPAAWSAEGNSWLIEATGEGQFHTEGGTIVDACVVQIGSHIIAYIENGQAPTLIPSAYHWTVTDEGAGVYRFECLSLAGNRMTGRARVLAGSANITPETVVDQFYIDQTGRIDDPTGTADFVLNLTAGKKLLVLPYRSNGGLPDVVGSITIDGNAYAAVGEVRKGGSEREGIAVFAPDLPSAVNETVTLASGSRRYHAMAFYNLEGWDVISVTGDATHVSANVLAGDRIVGVAVGKSNNPVFEAPMSIDFDDTAPDGVYAYGGGHADVTADASPLELDETGIGVFGNRWIATILLRPSA